MLYVGDVGKEIYVETEYEIPTNADVFLNVKKPDGTIVQWQGTIHNNTQILYITKDGDIDQKGKWYLQSYLEWTDTQTNKIHGDIISFEVGEL